MQQPEHKQQQHAQQQRWATWADYKRSWLSMNALLRWWRVLLTLACLVLTFVPFTNVDWWWAKEQRPLKYRVEIARVAVFVVLVLTTLGCQLWRLVQDSKQSEPMKQGNGQVG